MTYTLKPARFLSWFVGLTIGLPLLIAMIDYAVGVSLDSAAVSIIPMFMAAMQEGQTFAKREKRAPQSRESWHYAQRMTLMAVAASAVLAVPFLVFVPEILAELLSTGSQGLALLATMLALFVLIGFLSARFFFAFAARNLLKAEAKRIAKEAK